MPRERRRAAGFAFLALIVAAAGGCNKLKSKQEIKKGNEYFKAAKYGTALASYQEAARLDPGEAKLKKNIGLAYMGMYQPGSKHAKDLEYAGKAIENLKGYVAAYPKDRKAREFLVSMYLATDRYDEAIEFYQDLLKSNPKDGKALGSISAMHFKKGDFAKGVEWQKKLMQVEGEKPEPYIMIGVQAWDRSYHYPDLDPAIRGPMVEEGLAALQRALQLKPDTFEALTYINLLYREKAKLETDPLKQQEYMETANRYLAQALELRKKQQEAAKNTTPTPEPAS